MSLTVFSRLRVATTYAHRLEGEGERAWVCAEIAKIVRARWPEVADELDAASGGAQTRFTWGPPQFVKAAVAWCEDHAHDGQTTWSRHRKDKAAAHIPFIGVTSRFVNVVAFADLLRVLCPEAARVFLSLNAAPVSGQPSLFHGAA